MEVRRANVETSSNSSRPVPFMTLPAFTSAVVATASSSAADLLGHRGCLASVGCCEGQRQGSRGMHSVNVACVCCVCTVRYCV